MCLDCTWSLRMAEMTFTSLRNSVIPLAFNSSSCCCGVFSLREYLLLIQAIIMLQLLLGNTFSTRTIKLYVDTSVFLCVSVCMWDLLQSLTLAATCTCVSPTMQSCAFSCAIFKERLFNCFYVWGFVCRHVNVFLWVCGQLSFCNQYCNDSLMQWFHF